MNKNENRELLYLISMIVYAIAMFIVYCLDDSVIRGRVFYFLNTFFFCYAMAMLGQHFRNKKRSKKGK